MRRSIFLILAFLAGCGSAYITPSVKEVPKGTPDTVAVKVVPLTARVAAKANRSHYAPKRLPRVFYSVTETPAASARALAPPSPVTTPEKRPGSATVRIPPKLKPEPYRIGIADVLLLATPTATSTVEKLSGAPAQISSLPTAQSKRQGYTVQDDGAIAIPDVGRVNVAGLTLDEAEAEIFKALVKNQINPTFSLEISAFKSQRVTVGGAVAQPKLVPISLRPLHLGEALQLAGGIVAKDQDYTTIRLYRDGNLYEIPLNDFLAKAKLQRILLKDQDSIYVDTTFDLNRAQAYFSEQITLMNLKSSARAQALGRLQAEISIARGRATEQRANFNARAALDALPRDYVYLTGEVTRQGRFALPFAHKASLADALYSQAGIPTNTGNVQQIYVLRGNRAGDSVTAYQLDAQNIANMMLATRLELRPNDIIFVAEQPVTRWNRSITEMGPSLFQNALSRVK